MNSYPITAGMENVLSAEEREDRFLENVPFAREPETVDSVWDLVNANFAMVEGKSDAGLVMAGELLDIDVNKNITCGSNLKRI